MRNRKPFCIWKKNNYSLLLSDCRKHVYGFAGLNYCPYCGGKIITEDDIKEVIGND